MQKKVYAELAARFDMVTLGNSVGIVWNWTTDWFAEYKPMVWYIEAIYQVYGSLSAKDFQSQIDTQRVFSKASLD